ncbi:eyes absent homolog [Salvia miltiorrhiza]|uniref:eyes absent homolog n=1 Tax=Salvia miltiorrhiza TaxID=226208 RepID=UPI0025AC24E0|nr:eyes absent homolog [Salvia miltiorrhiza]XP_057792557.1 eyes absent homolog [Salvia miltiorrhiza]XP_057792558.1 eyes absent homolog [Salvia miltiorrhiza]
MDQKLKVYIWDMDETLILLKSLLTGTYAGAFNGLKDVQNGVNLGKLWENHILKVCDTHFFYDQIESFNQPYLDFLNQYDDGADLSSYNFSQDGFGPVLDALNKRKLAYRHRVVAEKYRKGLHNILNQDLIRLWESLYDLTDTYTERWLSSARACLEQCAGRRRDVTPSTNSDDVRDAAFEHINVLVTSGPLVPSLVKCLFFRLDNMITCNNVYSSLDVGKLQCFTWIKERFGGPNVQFCAIGDGWEECEAAESMRWPFVQIDPQPRSLHRFPGLNSGELKHYFSIVYGDDDDDSEDREKNRELL